MYELISKLEAAGGAAGFRVEKYGEAGGHPLVALTRRTPGPRPRIYVSAGIHGDEPAAPVAETPAEAAPEAPPAEATTEAASADAPAEAPAAETPAEVPPEATAEAPSAA